METMQGQTFAITKWDVWGHRILQWPNYLHNKVLTFAKDENMRFFFTKPLLA